jgi:hypothetical protein
VFISSAHGCGASCASCPSCASAARHSDVRVSLDHRAVLAGDQRRYVQRGLTEAAVRGEDDSEARRSNSNVVVGVLALA